ncbi:MAG TPA: hypothetical protein VNA89_14195 [Gemmatimonadaceae bacterium]|nr:hypothetical protein [Gemmatimonadaceae bacterium]
MPTPIAALLALRLAASCAPAPCDCAPPPPVLASRREADAVFLGRVRRVTDTTVVTPGAASPDDVLAAEVVVLEVLATWKGAAGGTVELRIPFTDCSVPFAAGEEYLVYATDTPYGLVTTTCSRTRPAGAAVGDMEALGEPRRPPPPASPRFAS